MAVLGRDIASLFGVLVALVTGCTSSERLPAIKPAAFAYPNEDAAIARAKRRPRTVLWRIPSGNTGVGTLRLSDDSVVFSGHDGVFVADARSGRMRWKRSDIGNAVAVRSADLFAADGSGGIVALSVARGTVRWRTRSLCSPHDARAAIGLIEATSVDVFVGCSEAGRLFRLDRTTGRKRAAWSFGEAARFTEILSLSSATIAVTVDTDGALLASHLVLLRASDLHQLADERQNAAILGVVGSTAIIDDECCVGNADGPVTLRYFQLFRGSFSAPRVIARPPDTVAGNGSSVAIAGQHLYISTAPFIDDYGDPLAPARVPKRLVDGLYEQAMFVARMRATVRVAGRDGRIVSRLLDFGTTPPRVLWQGRPEWVERSDPQWAPQVIEMSDSGPSQNGTVFLRVADGRVATTRDRCGFIASNDLIFVAQCRVGGSNGDSALEAFAFDSPSEGARR